MTALPVTMRHVLLPVEGGALPLTVAESASRAAAVVIMPSAFGVAADLEEQMRELARDARLVVTPDPFFRQDAGPAPYEDMARVMKRLELLDRERAHREFRATIDWARGTDGQTPVVLLGICIGGPFALRAAAEDAVAGVVTWHGTRMEHHLEQAARIRCPLRLHFGGVDPFVPMEAVRKVESAFATHPDVRVFVHDGATHGFSHRAASRAYNAPAEHAGMASVRELVARSGA